MGRKKPVKWCVPYRSGGPYMINDVVSFVCNVKQIHPEIPITIFSDDPRAQDYCEEWIPLEASWSQGVWSVTECFRLKGPVFFTGLDTVLCARIDDMFAAVQELKKNQFMMVRPVNPVRRAKGMFASGVMGWTGDFSWLYEEFPFKTTPSGREQDYTQKRLKEAGIKILTMDSICPGIASYKRHYSVGKMAKEDIRLLVFHGRPRPSEVADPWIKSFRRINHDLLDIWANWGGEDNPREEAPAPERHFHRRGPDTDSVDGSEVVEGGPLGAELAGGEIGKTFSRTRSRYSDRSDLALREAEEGSEEDPGERSDDDLCGSQRVPE